MAAAIGVGGDDVSGMPNGNLINPRHPNKVKNGILINPALGEINRSIEKMSIGGTNGSMGRSGNGSMSSGYPASGCVPGQTNLANFGQRRNMPSSQPMPTSNTRRDSNWTNSTEGYGSMRSEQSMQSSRRCSELSAMSQTSNVSTRALMNSPWDPISVDSSRRSSLNPGMESGQQQPAQQPLPQQQQHSGMSHHLDRLRKKAQTMQQQQTASVNMNQPMHGQQDMIPNSGRVSAMSECSMPGSASQMQMSNGYGMLPEQMNNPHGIRRASDPVRALDRNFGVNNAGNGNNLVQSQRNRTGGSYNQLNNMQQMQGRMPLHGQRIRGASGDSHFAQGNGMGHNMQPMNQVK